MSREKEENISRILEDVRRHSDASQTGFATSSSFSDTSETRRASLDSFGYSSGSLSDSTASSLSQSRHLYGSVLSAQDEEGCVGMEIEPTCNLASETSLTAVDSTANLSRMEFVDSGQGSSAGAESSRYACIGDHSLVRKPMEIMHVHCMHLLY